MPVIPVEGELVVDAKSPGDALPGVGAGAGQPGSEAVAVDVASVGEAEVGERVGVDEDPVPKHRHPVPGAVGDECLADRVRPPSASPVAPDRRGERGLGSVNCHLNARLFNGRTGTRDGLAPSSDRIVNGCDP